jgi:hypothetical protein
MQFMVLFDIVQLVHSSAERECKYGVINYFEPYNLQGFSIYIYVLCTQDECLKLLLLQISTELVMVDQMQEPNQYENRSIAFYVLVLAFGSGLQVS